MTVQLRRASFSIWEYLNPVLLYGEMGFENNNGGADRVKIGDGINNWNDLDAFETAPSILAQVAATLPTTSLPFAPFTTLARPSAALKGVGATYYDTTLTIPAWSDGTDWRDATGTVV